MLSKSFKSGKCKTSLKLAASRIKLLKNKRDIQVKHLRRELAQLLATGQEQTARIRVEHVIREEKTLSAYNLIEIYCELIVARLPIIESQKNCPIDLKEAVSSVIFASPRCADIPELVDARKQFAAKYGKEFATSALELRPNCGVNRMIVEKLSAQAPDTETKIKVLTAIAKEHDVKWDSEAFQESQRPTEDLLNGSSSFTRANKMPMESSDDNFSPFASQKEAASKTLQNEMPSKPSGFNSTSHTDSRTSTSPVVPTRNESMTSDRKAGDSYPSQGTSSSNPPTWTTEFKDAVSAAQAAAESAERASMAARAAAELAGRQNMYRQNSNNSNGSSTHSGGRNAVPNRVSSSKLKGDEHHESVNIDFDPVNGFPGVKEEPDNLPRDELREGMEKVDVFRESYSRTDELAGSIKKHREAEFVEDNVNVDYDRSSSASSMGVPDFDTIFTRSTGKHQSGNTREVGDYNQHTSSDYASPVFDEYVESKANLLDSFYNKKDDDDVFSIAPAKSAVNSIFLEDPIHENRTITLEKEVSLPKFDDSRYVTFDDSDGVSSDDEDEGRSSLKNTTVQNSSLLHVERVSSLDSGSEEVYQPSSSSKAKPLIRSEEKDELRVPSSVGIEDSERAGGGELDLKLGRLTGGMRNRGYNYPPYTASSVVDSSLPSKPITIAKDTHDQGSTREVPTVSGNKADTSGSGINHIAYDRESSIGYMDDEPNPANQDPYDSSAINALDATGSKATDQKIYVEKPHVKARRKLISRMSRTDSDHDGDKEASVSQINIGSRGNANPDSTIKLSRRTRGLFTKDRDNVPRSTGFSDTPNTDSESQPISRGVGEQSMHRHSSDNVEDKNIGGRPNPANTATSSGNIKASDSGGGRAKLPATDSPKAAHVHPKLPDYDTFAAHFHSLRSNHR